MAALNETASGITFTVKVQPRARKNAIIGELGTDKTLKITLTAPPVEGRANQACIEFLANLLDVPRSAVTIVSGERGRNKIIRVTGATLESLRSKLQAGLQ